MIAQFGRQVKQEKKEALKFLNSSTPIVEAPFSHKKNYNLAQMVIQYNFIYIVTILTANNV